MGKREGRYIKDYKKARPGPETPEASPPPAKPRQPPAPLTPANAPEPPALSGPASAKAAQARVFYANLAPRTYFKFKGGTSASGFTFFLVLSLGGGLLWGLLYGHLTYHNPAPLLGFVAAIIFAILLAGTVIFASIAGRVFSLRLMSAAAFASSFAAVYVSWMVFAHDHWQDLGVNDWVWRPPDLMAVLGDVAAKGRPLVARWFTVHQFLLPVWMVESVAIVAMGVAVVYMGMVDSCVCLSCRSWSENRLKGIKLGYPSGGARLKERLEAWDFTALSELGPPHEDAWAEVSLEICPDCGEIGFLRVDLARKQSAAGGATENEVLLKGLMLPGPKIKELEFLARPRI